MKIPFSPPRIDEITIEEVKDTLLSGWITTGPKTQLFEQNLASYLGIDHVVCLNSATAGLQLIMHYLGIKEGDEVIIPSYGFVSLANAIVLRGAKPIFAEIDPKSLNISTQDIDIGIGENNAKRWLREGKTSFQPQEREMWNSIKDLGFVDTWRIIHPEDSATYSWFDYRSRMFDQNPKRGLRIDHIMLSENLKDSINDVGIDHDARAMEKPSDHCPIWLDLNE